MARSLRATQQGLDNIIDPARIKKKWNMVDDQWTEAADVSRRTLQRFWNRELIRRPNFIAICQAIDINDWQEIVDPTFPPAPSVYNRKTWVGRNSLIDNLLTRLNEQIRIVWLTGISGIGKTTLGECIACKAWESYSSFKWVYLEILDGQSVGFADIAVDLLYKLEEKEIDPQERNNPKYLADHLIRKLQKNRYWLQIDALEHLLSIEKPSEFCDTYWVTFFQRCLTEPNFNSHLVLTSQALPNALVEFSDRYPNYWNEITLRGLSANGQDNEHLEFFRRYGVRIADESSTSFLSKIGQIYEGHPLVLQVISKEIHQDYDNNVTQYWDVNYQEFDQVARELRSKRLNETEYNEVLDRRVRERIRKSIEKLPLNSLYLLCRSAVYRLPVPKKFWFKMIDNCSYKEQKKAYQMLNEHSLVEQKDIQQGVYCIRQHNLIRDIAYDLLKEDLTEWQIAEYKAAEAWLTDYKPPSNTRDLERVRGYLEAFSHYSQLEDWEKARDVFFVSFDENKEIQFEQRLDQQLDIWGYFNLIIESCEQLIGKLSLDIDINCFNSLAKAYLGLCDYQKAIKFSQDSLKISRQIHNSQGECEALQSLGIICVYTGQYKESFEYLEQALQITRQINYFVHESIILSNLGILYRKQSQYQNAIDCYELALDISHKIGDIRGEAIVIGSLGTVYGSQGRYEEAIKCHKRHLTFSQNISDRVGQAAALMSLGIQYKNLGDFIKSSKFNEKALQICQEIGDRNREGSCLTNLGNAYRGLKQYPEAIDCFEKRLAIAEELNDLSGQGYALGGLGCIYEDQENYLQAIEYYQKAFDINIQVNNLEGQGINLCNIGGAFINLERYSEASQALQNSLDIAIKIGDREGEAYNYLYMAGLYYKQKQKNPAFEFVKKALNLSQELKIPLFIECEELKGKIENDF